MQQNQTRQVAQTSPYVRDVTKAGFPIKVSELLSALDGREYIERVAVNNVKALETGYNYAE